MRRLRLDQVRRIRSPVCVALGVTFCRNQIVPFPSDSDRAALAGLTKLVTRNHGSFLGMKRIFGQGVFVESFLHLVVNFESHDISHRLFGNDTFALFQHRKLPSLEVCHGYPYFFRGMRLLVVLIRLRSAQNHLVGAHRHRCHFL